ncbi:U-box domain-containing protein 33-like isoform X2 [Silene latifolia]
MGAAANSSYSRRMLTPMSKKASFVLLNAPKFCHIWFVCNNHLVYTREGAWQRTGKTERFFNCTLPCVSAGGSSSQSSIMHNDSLHSSMPTDIINILYTQLQQTTKELKESTEKLHTESMKRQTAEKEASEANLKVQAADNDLILMEADLRHTKIRLDDALDELDKASVQLTTFGSQTKKWYLEAKEMENKLASSENLQNMYKKLSNGLQEKLNLIARDQHSLDFHILSCEYSLSDLEEATNCFDSSLKVGEGGIYRGFLNHTDVAIKMLHTNNLQGPLEFKQEVDILSKLRHPNIVILLGICSKSWGLIYEYLPNGSLQDQLNCKDNTPPLPWQTRIQIAIELCSVLNFLHSRKPNSIIHGAINLKNVLLDGNFVSKLSGFGSCRVMSNNEVDFQMACKTDVYSFGVILLCLLTAESPSGIVEKVQFSLENNDFFYILDHSAGQWPFVRATQLAHMALRCCHEFPDDRPDLASEVWMVLKPSNDPSQSLSPPMRLIKEGQIPPYFICPIVQEIMQDPHFAADGFTYEGEAIRAWFDGGHETSPMTNLRLTNCHLTPNRALHSAIEEWQQKHRYGFGAPVHSLTDNEVASFREQEKQEIVAILDDCGQICKIYKVPFQTIQVQNVSITEGILEIIINLRIQKLVMGAAANSSYSRGMLTPTSKKANIVLHSAPNFCHIWFVCNNHLVFTRECTWRGTGETERILNKSSYYESVLVSLPCTSAGGSSSQSSSMHHGSPSSKVPPSIIDRLYAQLLQANKELKESTGKLHVESKKWQEAEKEASEANLKVQATGEDLIQMQAEFKDTKTRLDNALVELKNAFTKQLSLGSQTLKWYLKVKEMKNKLASTEDSPDIDKKLPNRLPEKLDPIAQEQQSLSFHKLSCEYLLLDLEEATNCFDPSLKIAEGGYGNIYRGFLNHTDVAIKMLDTYSVQGALEFRQEVDVFSNVRHPNLVTLLGICTKSWGLIYEYLPNGSLQDRLNCKDNSPSLPWQTRIQIATELCSVLNFLHSRKPKSIVHGDINPKNVLLDGNFVCKLSGFGSSRVISNDEVDFQIACKIDVYSFGIILLCLLTAEPPSGIVEKVQFALDNDDLSNILDHSAGQWPFVRAKQLVHMALRCCHAFPDNRPDLASDVWMLLKPSNDPSRNLATPVRLINEDRIPSYFICPILQEIMQDPHFAADGFTYEGEAIKAWFDGGHDTSPMTNLRLENCHLTPNRALHSAIEEWQQKHRCV